MSKHKYKPGDKVTFAVSREHFVESVDYGKVIAENCFNALWLADVESYESRTGDLYLVGRDHDGATYLTASEVNICIKPYTEHKQQTLTPQTDRERMLCDALLRKCRWLPVESKTKRGQWSVSNVDSVLWLDIDYRPAQKLPEIPWQWIDKKYNVCVVDVDGAVGLKTSLSSHETHIQIGIKLDLTYVTLPVTIERPKGEK